MSTPTPPWLRPGPRAGRALPCYGTTHADYFYGEIPCARNLTPEEIEEGYEKNTGRVIAETFQGKNPMHVPAVLCRNHGPFTWGTDAKDAVHNAMVLEEVARMNLYTEMLNPGVQPAPQCIQDKHFLRKHGPGGVLRTGKTAVAEYKNRRGDMEDRKTEIRKAIEEGRTALGIELGSTRIKAVLIDETHSPVAAGSYQWENRLENGYWTYSMEDVRTGLQACYADLAADVERQYQTKLKTIGAAGSAP